MKQLLILFLYSAVCQWGISQTEWKSETIHGTLKGMYFTATIDYKVDCDYSTPFVRATLKDIEVHKFEYEGKSYQYEYGLPMKADEGFLVLDGNMTLVKGGDFNGTFDLNKKQLSSKIGGSGNAMTADEFRFTNESELTETMNIKSCTGALEKLKYSTAILEITTTDLDKYDGDLRLNGQAINDILVQEIKKHNTSTSNSSSEGQKSYLETAKEEKNVYMKQLDQEEKMQQNRDAQNERELNQIRRSNQDPTIRAIEETEKNVDQIFDNYWDQAAKKQEEEHRRITESMEREREEENRQAREENKKHDIYLEYRDHLTEREKLIAPLRNELKAVSMDYDKAYRGLHKAFIEAKENNASELYVLPIFQYSHLNYNKETYEMYDKEKYYIETFTPIKFDLSTYDTQKGNTWTEINKIIRTELQNQGHYRSRRNNLVFMHNSSSDELLANLRSITNKYDESILVYRHHNTNSESIEEKFHEVYLKGIEDEKRIKEKEQTYNNLKKEFDQALESNAIEDLKEFISNHPESEFVKDAEEYIKNFYVKKLIVKYQEISSLKYYRNLEQLIFHSYCKLKSFPQEILELKKLKQLIINPYVPKIKLPNDINKLENLEYLYMFNIDSLPKSFGSLNNLEKFICGSGPISIPKEFSNLTNLKTLKIAPRYHDENMDEIYNLANLEILEIEAYHITDEIEKLKKLKILNLYDCQTISSNIFKLKTLEELYLNNISTTSIPVQQLELKSLKRFSIHNYRKYGKEVLDISPFLSIPSLQHLEIGQNDKKYFGKKLKDFKNSHPGAKVEFSEKHDDPQWHLESPR